MAMISRREVCMKAGNGVETCSLVHSGPKALSWLNTENFGNFKYINYQILTVGLAICTDLKKNTPSRHGVRFSVLK